MPGRVLQTAAAAVVLSISVPVVFFAIFTSIFALILLGVRASILSSEFWLSVIFESWLQPQKQSQILRPATPAAAAALPNKQSASIEFRPPMAHSRTNSFIDTKRLSHRSDSHVSLVGTPINRDFEGVGGWRSAHDDEDQHLWVNMKNRLDRTRSSSRHHIRSATGGSVQTSTVNSPELYPMPMRTPRQRPGTSGSASPQSYFSLSLPTSRSMVSLQPKRLSGHSSDKWDSQQGRPQSLELDREPDQTVAT